MIKKYLENIKAKDKKTIGIVVAFVVSILAIKFLVGYIKKHDFIPFGIYRIVLGAILLIYFLIKM